VWSNSAKFMIIRVNVQWRRSLVIPIPVWVVDEFLGSFTDLACAVETVVKHRPFSPGMKERKQLSWIETFSLSGLIEALHTMVNELCRSKGLEFVDVKVRDVKFSVSLK
jgi:hypothetical protein